VDNSAPLQPRPQSTYESGNSVQTSGATSLDDNVVQKFAAVFDVERIQQPRLFESSAYATHTIGNCAARSVDQALVSDCVEICWIGKRSKKIGVRQRLAIPRFYQMPCEVADAIENLPVCDVSQGMDVQ
jgi:hypothetical protein